MWTLVFWKSVFERSFFTFIEALAASLTVYVGATGLEGVDWLHILSIAGLSFVYAVLKNILSGLKSGNPSVGNVEVLNTIKVSPTNPVE